ncbi:MAG: hypothetical protein AB1724_06205 [Thermodesulfobacteriota bacterium]
MFLLGVKVDHDSAAAFLVILEKQLKNVRNFFVLRDARHLPAAACQEEMAAFYHDDIYTIRKRVFSQDRRPKKDVSARPALVMAAGEKDLPVINTLRDKGIPVEAIFTEECCPGPPPERAGIGKNHAVSEQAMVESLNQVLAQKRLDVKLETPSPFTPQLSELDRLLNASPQDRSGITAPPLLMAAAAPIWFKENVRYAAVYRTSATSVRKYK